MYELEERFEVRRKIQKAGAELLDSIEDEDLKYLAGEIIALNEDYVLLHKETIGAEIILERGFTRNQETWIRNLNEKLKGARKDV